jgi:hypothetical protein
MAHAYTPGLQVKERALYRAARLLPIAGEVLVQPGQFVQAQDVVARALQPGPVTPLNLANLLGTAPADVPRCLLRKPGERIEASELLARSNGIFGMFRTSCTAPSEGTIESVSGITGQLILRSDPVPVEVRAFATGQVVELVPGEGCIVESQATFIQGIFGIGGEAFGPIRLAVDNPQADLTPEQLSEADRGAIVIGGARIHGATVQRAVELGVSALVAGGIDDQDLRDILGYDLGVAITGTEQIGITLVITEGFGDIAMADRTFALLQARAGQAAAINGATQIRAGVLRPELVIPWDDQSASLTATARIGGGVLELGSQVRIIRDPYFGALGEVSDLPSEPQLLGSGSRARVLEVRTRSGERVIVPRANVELVSE